MQSLAKTCVCTYSRPAQPPGVSNPTHFLVYARPCMQVGDNFLKDFGGTRALLVGGAIAAMKITDTVHPPVGAYAVLMADVPTIKV